MKQSVSKSKLHLLSSEAVRAEIAELSVEVAAIHANPKLDFSRVAGKRLEHLQRKIDRRVRLLNARETQHG